MDKNINIRSLNHGFWFRESSIKIQKLTGENESQMQTFILLSFSSWFINLA